tara:strand:+ start:117 stop:500 length:384 start_codon:yes stop_codon:yes gene_type:complete
MKKQLIINSLLSGCAVLILGLFDLLSFQSIIWGHYFAVLFFWAVYCAQTLLLLKKKITPAHFIMLYNLTTVIKMVFSGIFIVGYFMFLTKQPSHSFLAFFLFLYFGYLIINTLLFFNKKHGKTNKPI